MIAAMKLAQEQDFGVNDATLQHGVPLTTLKDHLSSCIQHGTKPGLLLYLNEAEEKELSSFIVNCVSVGYAKTCRVVVGIV